ncbi:MAG: NAD-binding protein [Acidimicrobiales bacterium]
MAAGIEQATALAAVTSGDNSNILVAHVARETFGIDRVVARIYDPRRARSTSASASLPSPPSSGPPSRCSSASCPSAPPRVDRPAKVLLVERPVPPAWAGKKTEQLDVLGHARIGAIRTARRGRRGRTRHDPARGDLVHVMLSGDSIDFFDQHLAGGPQAGGH